jgi:hypothetical protein
MRLADLDTMEKKNVLFRFACQNFEPGNVVCYYCIEQYKSNANKRKAVFIFDNFLKVSTQEAVGKELSDSETYKVLRTANIGAGEMGTLGDTIGKIKKVKTFLGKLLNKELVEEYSTPRADLFDRVHSLLATLMNGDWLANTMRFHLVPDTYALNPKWSPQIQASRRKLAEAGFYPDSMGVYG